MKNLNAVKLKIKAMSLAEEARIIRKLEKGCENKHGFNSIYDHRINDVRNEARATNIARAFLSGKQYKDIENSRKPEREFTFGKVLARATKIIKKYGDSNQDQDFHRWIEGCMDSMRPAA